jgi:hypothetical protein
MTNTVFQCFKVNIFLISYEHACIVVRFPEISSLKMSLLATAENLTTQRNTEVKGSYSTGKTEIKS